MRVKTFNHIDLARFFLIGLLLVGIYTVWSGILPDEMRFIPCLFHLITDISCPGCGMTRACVSLAQGKFTAAWHYHPFAFFLVPLALGISFAPTRLRRYLAQTPPSRPKQHHGDWNRSRSRALDLSFNPFLIRYDERYVVFHESIERRETNVNSNDAAARTRL